MKKRLLALSGLLAVLCCTSVSAQTAKPKTGGITISPASQEIVFKNNQKLPQSSFTITNNSDMAETFELTTVDMGALEDTGGLAFSGLPEDYQRKYGLAQWLDLSRKTVTIKPQGKEVIGFSIRDESSLSPGGHYGAVVVRRANQAFGSDQRIALSPQAASLIFLRKVGGEVYGLSLPDATSDHSIWRLPTRVKLPFKNEGNVHVVPRGIVRVKNSFGREVAKGIINPESALVLPERTRTLSVALETHTKSIWPGKYTIEIDYRYDGQDKTAHYRQTFYTANLRVFLLLVGTLAVILLVGYKFRRTLRRIVHTMRTLPRKLAKRRHK